MLREATRRSSARFSLPAKPYSMRPKCGANMASLPKRPVRLRSGRAPPVRIPWLRGMLLALGAEPS